MVTYLQSANKLSVLALKGKVVLGKIILQTVSAWWAGWHFAFPWQKRPAPLPRHMCLGIIASDFPWFRVYTEKENVRICPELGILNVIFKAWKKSVLFIAGKGMIQLSHSMWVPSSVVHPHPDLSMATPWKVFLPRCKGTVHTPPLEGPGWICAWAWSALQNFGFGTAGSRSRVFPRG